MKRVFISDCEGPISKNDNAYELTAHFVPDGDKLFTLVSKYDDVLADVLKRPGYNAGDTLKLILPFLKAYGATDKQMHEFSAGSLVLVANSVDTLRHVLTVAEAFIVSTSYEHYVKAMCEATGFPFRNVYCTRVSIDQYAVTEKEEAKLKELAKETTQMPMISFPTGAESLSAFSSRDQATIRRLDEIFWKEVSTMNIGRIFTEVTAVGGYQKAEAVKDIATKLRLSLEDVMYVGDSITDVEAFKLVRENSGLTVSFNGNGYAVKNAEVAVLSENNTVTAVIADVFCRHGKHVALQLVENWNFQSLQRNALVSLPLLDHLFSLYPAELPKVQIVTPENMETLAQESSEFRKKVRGEAIGRLG